MPDRVSANSSTVPMWIGCSPIPKGKALSRPRGIRNCGRLRFLNSGSRHMASSSTISLEANSGDSRAAFRFGIEEEYFLSDAATLRPAVTTPDSLFKRLGFSGARLERELLQSQMEVATRPHLTSNAARDELKELREAAARTCKRHGLKILACGTHPMGAWRDSVHSPKPRYEQLLEDLQILARRNMLCGMHVHVEIPEAGRRIEIMSRMLPYLPLLLALSTSSPFWEGSPTGLKGYRLTAYDELPRTGLPELFTCEKDHAEYLDAMRQSGAIADASQVWWSIRPSPKYPTLELRAPDCCTRLDDAVAIASLYRVMVRHLHRCPHVTRASAWWSAPWRWKTNGARNGTAPGQASSRETDRCRFQNFL